MAQTDENSIDQLLDRVHRDTEQVKNAVGPGDAAALAGVAAAMDQIAKDIASVAGGGGPADTGPRTADAVSEALGHGAASVEKVGDLHRLLAIEVPVIVQLGIRRMTIGEVMRLGVGAIVEFSKSAEEEMDLLANNMPIGKGYAVKVGENFGIKVSSIGSVKETIRKLGGV